MILELEDPAQEGSTGLLFSKRYWRATLFISGFWFCAVAPYFAIATFADSVLQQYGLSGGLAGGVGLSAVAGVVVCVLLIDKLGRRVLTIPPQWVCAVVLAIIGLWAGAPPAVVLALFPGRYYSTVERPVVPDHIYARLDGTPAP